MKEKFVWGAATASYQIEGAKNEDGKGLSVWDVFCEKQGAIKDGSTGDVACDHYHRYREDVALMGELGLNAYRFSVSWPRVMPDGVTLNPKGLDFYDRLTDELLSRGIDPYVTLYHWDLPYALHLKGGWLNRDIAGFMGDYAAAVVGRLGDRVKNVITLNEPQVFLNAGYGNGEHAPGLSVTVREQLAAIHNVLLSHGTAAQAAKTAYSDVRIGYASAGYAAVPKRPQDYEAAYDAFFDYDVKNPCGCVAIFGDPLALGDYDRSYYEKFAAILPEIRPGDMKLIGGKLDFYGQNCYAGQYASRENGETIWETEPFGALRTTMNWNVLPECIYAITKMVYERYGKPVYITENGAAYADVVCEDGKIHDSGRCDYLRRHIRQALLAKRDGVDLRGYFVWSLLDNFEWREGYTQRFGIVRTDFETGERVKKDSFHTYAEIIKSDGKCLE